MMIPPLHSLHTPLTKELELQDPAGDSILVPLDIAKS